MVHNPRAPKEKFGGLPLNDSEQNQRRKQKDEYTHVLLVPRLALRLTPGGTLCGSKESTGPSSAGC